MPTFEEDLEQLLGKTSPKSEEEPDEEIEEEEAEDEPSDDRVDRLLETIGELKSEINNLKGKKKEEEAPPVEEYKPSDFAGDDFDIDNPKEGLNKIANRISQKTQESTIRSVVPIIQSVVTQAIVTQTAINNFWQANSDLVEGKSRAEVEEIKKKVGRYANAIQSHDSSKSLDEVLSEAGAIVRGKTTDTKSKAKKKVAKTPAPPSSKRKGFDERKKKKSAVADEIDSLFN